MAEHTFESKVVEEFYNSCHGKADGKFCGAAAKGKGVTRVPMSDAARQSNAILRSMSAARKSKDYKVAKKAINKPWGSREVGQGGLRNVKGANSKKADLARAANAKKGAQTKAGQPNKDGSTAHKGAFKITGNKTHDMINITKLDRGSPERKKAATAFQKHYGAKDKFGQTSAQAQKAYKAEQIGSHSLQYLAKQDAKRRKILG